MPQSAREMLRLPGRAPVLWATFDPDWYRRTYPDARDAAPEAALDFYLDRGQRLGHAPNRVFDERWYLRRYPDVAEAVRAGDWESGFDHYCRQGFASRSPHWLYDDGFYRKRYGDLADDLLAASGFVNRYDHYLKHGNPEGRRAHPLFDPGFYIAHLQDEELRAEAEKVPFIHYLLCLESREWAQPEPPPSPYFDPAWYRERYPAIDEAIRRGEWLGALHHYTCNDAPSEFDPNPLFSESWYCERYEDVNGALRRGEIRNGYEHFLAHGVAELRSPSASVDLKYYVKTHPTVARDVANRVAPDAFAHLVCIGLPQGLRTAPDSQDELPPEPQTKTLIRSRARSLLPLYGRNPLRFDVEGTPELSVIMVLHNAFAVTMMALASLRDNFPGGIELILVDSGSTDETRHITRFVTGAKVLQFVHNIGYLRACNAALRGVSAEAVLYLNNDVELAPGAIKAALARLRSDPTIGAVGGKIIRTHGLLQEAGGIIWRDGSTSGYLRDASPLAPEANFVRDVDYCSAVFLLVRTSLLKSLEGFDEEFAPAYYEDTDLCVRIAEAGFRVVYDPAIVVHHLEYGSARSARDSEMQIARGRQVFAQKHFNYLLSRHRQIPGWSVFTRTPPSDAVRLLFIEDRIPVRMLGSGFVRSNDLVRTIAGLGCDITIFPTNAESADIATIYADLPDTAEIMHDKSLADFPAFMAERAGYYDVIWIARTHNMEKLAPALEPKAGGARIVLDTEAIAALRSAERAAIEGSPFAFDEALRAEFVSVPLTRSLVAVSESEAEILRRLGFDDVAVIGHLCEPRPTGRAWGERAGMLFLGAMHKPDAPNLDSLAWFVDQVLPLVEEELGWETQLTIAGFVGDQVALDRFAEHARITLAGPVTDPVRLYDTHRVFIAPTRFAAGVPYKVHEAAAHGLPVVATELLRAQLGWSDGVELLSAASSDARGFADRIVRLHRDEALWQRVREGALLRVEAENGAEQYARAVRAVLNRGATPARVIPFQKRA
ncbi:MAG: glycosyltransferase [Acetobacteraceae bacterium]|nr:glycosyltransferase [Acetobacteraceae bacterium]